MLPCSCKEYDAHEASRLSFYIPGRYTRPGQGHRRAHFHSHTADLSGTVKEGNLDGATGVSITGLFRNYPFWLF